MSHYSNYDLWLMLGEIKSDVKSLITKAEATIQWQAEHEKEDAKRFLSLERYGKSIALVSGGISAAVMYFLTGGKS